MRRYLLLILGMLFILTGVAVAADVLRDVDCTIGSNEVRTGNVFAVCQDLVVEGRIEGNLIASAFTTNITGTVTENVYLFGGQAIIAGETGDDVHFAGIDLRITSQSTLTDSDLIALTLSTTIEPGSEIGGGMVGFGYQTVIDGAVSALDYYGVALVINGDVTGDVDAIVGDSASQGTASQLETLLIPFPFDVNLFDPGLRVGETGTVQGMLRYEGPSPGVINGEVDAVTYLPIQRPPALEDLGTEGGAGVISRYLRQVFREFSTLGLLGLVILIFAPGMIQYPIETMRRRPLVSFVTGVLAFLLSFPIVLVFFILSVVLLLLLSLLRLDGVLVAGGILLGVGNIGGTSLFYFVALYVSRAVIGVAIGRAIVINATNVADNNFRSWLISLVVGILILAFAASVPTVGWVFNAFAMFLGLGALLTLFRTQFMRRSKPSNRPVVYYAADSIALRPDIPTIQGPSSKDGEPPQGMSDLPPGFIWWDDDSKRDE